MSSQAVFVGNLVYDSELRYTPGGVAVTNNRVACNEFYNDKNGEKQKRTSFINLESWGFRAEDMSKLRKGDKVVVVATPRFVTPKEGEKGELVFNVVEIGVCPKNTNGNSESKKAAPNKKAPPKKTTKTVEVTEEVESETNETEDIPF